MLKKKFRYYIFMLLFAIGFGMNASTVSALDIEHPLNIKAGSTLYGVVDIFSIYGSTIIFMKDNPQTATLTVGASQSAVSINSVTKFQILSDSVTAFVPVTATSYSCSSDLRWKKNITPIEGALQKVLGLRGVNYFWKVDEYKDKGFTREKQIGFVAQEVEKIMPELVNKDKDGYKSMSYDRVTALLVEAVKELKKESDKKIFSLQEESKSLKKENEQLKNRLASLEKLEKRMAALEKANSKGVMVGMK